MKHFLKLLHNIYFLTSVGLLGMFSGVCECSFGGIAVYSVFDQLSYVRGHYTNPWPQYLFSLWLYLEVSLCSEKSCHSWDSGLAGDTIGDTFIFWYMGQSILQGKGLGTQKSFTKEVPVTLLFLEGSGKKSNQSASSNNSSIILNLSCGYYN